MMAGCVGMMCMHSYAQDSTAIVVPPVVSAAPAEEIPFVWSLQDCINWAKQQNISVQRNKVNVRTSQIDLEDAKNNRLPTVSFSSNQQVGSSGC